MRTNAGRDWQARVMGDTSSTATGTYAPANWVGLTADATAPSASNTSLSGELSGGTMGRAQATYAHTNGTASYTLTRAFVSDRTVTVQKVGVFTAGSGGTMAFETLLSDPVPLRSGDSFQVVETVTI